MQKNEENVLVIRRALFDELGAFQGLERDADRYIEAFMTRKTISSCRDRGQSRILPSSRSFPT